ncbi:MAG: hypothetical protein ABSH20_15670, partial [Tepidisphaeraceae bacterium]
AGLARSAGSEKTGLALDRWFEKIRKIFRPTSVARSARERGALLVVRNQGVMACKAGKKDCQAAMSVVVHWCFNALVGHGLADCKLCLCRWLCARKAGADAG